ncbi:MAG: hypothetical protein M1837_000611 [Sclerophora amabilis]|nr:MAG: hypothetical protein M1837_000611 [Sclerophora amabilis]
MPAKKTFQPIVLTSDSDATNFSDELQDIGPIAQGAKLVAAIRQKNGKPSRNGGRSEKREPCTPKKSAENANYLNVRAKHSRNEKSVIGEGEAGDIENQEYAAEADAEADDEDDDILSQGPAIRKPEDQNKLNKQTTSEVQDMDEAICRRPSGRWWLHHVEVPLRTSDSQSTTNTMAGTPKSRRNRLTKEANQAPITSFFVDMKSKASQSLDGKENSSPHGINSKAKKPTADSDVESEEDILPQVKKSIKSIPRAGPSVNKKVTSPYFTSSKEKKKSPEPTDMVIDLCEESEYEEAAETADDYSSSEDDHADPSEPDSDDSSFRTPAAKRARVQMTFGKSGKLDGLKKSSSQERQKGKGKKPKGSLLRNDAFSYKLGTDLSLPPLHDIEEIFEDMTSNAVGLGLAKAVSHLANRKLRLATMCSGTESPLLALDLIAESLRKHHGVSLNFEHCFSAEIVPYKQAYIDRNFSPPVIFRDVREMVIDDEATSAYGAKFAVPGDIDILVSGWSCVDFSQLNRSKQGLESVGESGDTFRAILGYAKKWRPTLIVLENVCNAPWDKVQAIWDKEGRYHAQFLHVDSKHYYIPQTRRRGYMVCIDKDKMKATGNPAGKWVDMMKNLKRDASCSIESFLLPEDDSRVHRAREELLRSSRGEEKPPREVDWTTCQGRHQDYRNDLALGWKRPVTQWEDNGSCRMPDYAWADWAQGQVERIWDTIDISNNRNARRGFDCQYKTRYWDLSQNIDRFQDTTAFGLAGCITPSGQPFITYRGGPMIGQESLALQGIPIDKILLTRETQRQLQDLAGNAMTSTVVGAGVLAALMVGFRALKPGTGKILEEERLEDVETHIGGEDELVDFPADLSKYEIVPVDFILAQAQQSSQFCYCEGPTSQTSRQLQRCRDCHQTTCVKCGGIPAHNYEVIPQDEIKNRLDPGKFEDWLKDALPMRLEIANITKEAVQSLKDSLAVEVEPLVWNRFKSGVGLALEGELRFHSVKRSRIWTVRYESPASSMELIIGANGAEWRIYAKVNNSEPGNSLARKVFSQPFARMRPHTSSLINGDWEVCIPTTKQFSVNIEGQGDTRPSWENSLGLQEPGFVDGMVWTSLRITAPAADVTSLDEDICGDYDLLQSCGTASGSLHKKRTEAATTPLYLFLDPSRLGDPKNDSFIFSTDIRRLNYGERRSVVARLDRRWRPPTTAAKKGDMAKTKGYLDGLWVNCPKAVMQPVESHIGTSFSVAPPDLHVDMTENSCAAANTMLSCKVKLPENEIRDEKLRLKEGEWMEIDRPSERRVLSSFAWLTERLRKIPGLHTWKELRIPAEYRQCNQCAPSAPRMKWRVQKMKMAPYEDPKEAGPHERSLKFRPSPFITQIRIFEDNRQMLRIGLNITTLVHRALSNLPVNGGDLSASWRLDTGFVSSAKINLPKLTLPSNKLDPPAEQPPNIRLPLRPEQLRSLHWMIAQEDDSAIPFVEEEIEEAILPQLGWRAEGRATKSAFVRGGVLADQVGYGKTATTLGLIASQARRQGRVPDVHGKVAIKATLVVVPSQLTKQWQGEIVNFFGNRFKVQSITNPRQLTALTVRDFQQADIIIVSWNLFSNETYLTKLADFAAIPEMPSSEGRAFSAWFKYAEGRVAEHVEILKSDGAKHLHELLQAELASFEADSELSNYVPSKRLRGAAYRAAQIGKAKGKKAKATKSGKKRSIDELEDEDEDEAVEEDQQTQVPFQNKAQSDRLRSDPFYLQKAKNDWMMMHSPIFQMFKFRRLVVDEYTYAKDKNHTSITHIDSDLRWVLSGTPPLGDFADVKTIAVFLGINLGIDDDAIGVLKVSNMKKMQRDRTAAEAFRAFKDVRSPAWHINRHAVAQRFLNQFVRQNIAEIDEIPFQEELRPIPLSAAERAIYIELHQHLLSQDMRIRKGKSKSQSDRERRLNEMIGESKTPEEALVKKCSHFFLDDFEVDEDNPTQACDLIVSIRQQQYDDLIAELQKELQCAVWLKRYCVKGGEDSDTHFQNWMGNVRQNVNGDLEVTAALSELIDNANANFSKDDGNLFFRQPSLEEKEKGKAKGKDKDKDKKEEKDLSKSKQVGKAKGKAPAKPAVEKGKVKAKKVAPRKLIGKGKRKAASSESDFMESSEESEDPDEMDIDEDGEPVEAQESRSLMPASVSDKVAKLRLMTVHLRRLATELLLRQRSLRFMRLVRCLQLAKVSDESGPSACCSKCNQIQSSSESLAVFIVCGHSVCDKCRETYQHGIHCIVTGCNASVVEHQIVRANDLDGIDLRSRGAQHYGGKLEAVIELIRNETDADDQVLLFVQFDDLTDKVSVALDENNVSHAVMKTKAKKAENVIEDFQKQTGKNKKKVLILNIADESAAGANLTNANHVIFLSPLLADTQYQYESSMAQAVGRARRYGQRKVVHVYHFLSLKTIDVDTIEQRNSKRLVQDDDGNYELKAVSRADYEQMESWGAGRVRRQNQADSD